MPPRKFQRRREDFHCQNCGALVKGTGYTNHCPRCLWSKHVDVWPGDRAELCRGLMEPVGLVIEDGEHIISHRCQKCRRINRNKATTKDDQAVLIELSSRKS